MLVYLQRYFWAVVLGFIATASGMGIGAINALVGTKIEPAPLMPGESRGGYHAPLAAAAIDAQHFGHLFGIEPPPPPPETTSAVGGPGGFDPVTGRPRGPGALGNGKIDMNADPVKSGMRVQLLATMVASDKRWSMALISDLDAQKSAYYLPGDMLRDCTVYDILRGGTEKMPEMRVVIINPTTNRLEYIDATPGTGTAAPVALGVTPIPAPNEPATGGDGIKQVEKGKYEISRAKLDSTLANLNELATQARIVPNFKNGTSNGFKLFSIQPGSLYSAIGIQNGDVITQINGLDINSPEKALEIYTRLKDSSNIQVNFERNGQSQSSTYNITGGG